MKVVSCQWAVGSGQWAVVSCQWAVGSGQWAVWGLALLVAGCSGKADHAVEPAFYYWKSRFNINVPEREYLERADIDLLYVKFLDIDWDENRQEAIPTSMLSADTSAFLPYRIIPCVFITNRVFTRTGADQIPILARKIGYKIRDMAGKARVEEIQIDCDWTETTREAFFRFLEEIRKNAAEKNWEVSATIRLHQWKFPDRTGVPPVDKGVLMFYNTGDVADWQEPNSILNLETAGDYLNGSGKYPLHLDLALPVFHWGALFRDDRLVKLINNLDSRLLSDTSRFIKIAEGRYEVIKSTYLEGYYLYSGDRLRLENVDFRQLETIVRETGAKLDPADRRLIFYHLDSANLSVLPYESLKDLVDSAAP